MMRSTIRSFSTFSHPARLLMVNQFGINAGFYMLMPFLAAHLSSGLGLAGAVVGFLLGLRNFSQQGMFAVGGALTDRFGPRPLIIAGCALRVAGFACLGLSQSLPGLLAGVLLVGGAGALFNPAVRTYLAEEAGERRVEAFACFNVFFQAGMLVGPVAGLALTAWDFTASALGAAAIFAVLTLLQLAFLPGRDDSRDGGRETVPWKAMARNRAYVAFTAVMAAVYLLNFQVYLAYPLALRDAGWDGTALATATAALFAVFGAVTIAFQVPLSGWCRRRLGGGATMTAGIVLLSGSFLVPPLLSTTDLGAAGTFAGVLASGVALTLATAMVFPVEMDTVVALSGGRSVGRHYGVYQTVGGIGITAGNMVGGQVLDAWGTTAMWLCFAGIGALASAGMALLVSRGAIPLREREPVAV
ncbi:MFS transporter [Salininema proteolyticum]|uniref:MFS transporter n=1 Tax=Salininema proteolyticum TaxID=1607685 RepID=A0ABV8TW30_9ACTN